MTSSELLEVGRVDEEGEAAADEREGGEGRCADSREAFEEDIVREGRKRGLLLVVVLVVVVGLVVVVLWIWKTRFHKP